MCFRFSLSKRNLSYIFKLNFAPLTVLSTHLSEVISFHLLRQDAMFPAFNFLFDILISSSTFLICVSQCAGISALLFSCNSSCRIGTIGSVVFCNFDGMGVTVSVCTEVFLLMPSGHRTKKMAGFCFGEIYEGKLI